MACATRSWLAVIVVIFAAMSPAAAEPKRVLLLHSFGANFAPWVSISGYFREQLFKLSSDKIDLYEASLEGARFREAVDERSMVDYLASLFGSRKLDLIVTMGGPAALFIQKYRTEFFQSTPLVMGAVELRLIDGNKLTLNDAPVPVALDFKDWINDTRRVRPDTKHIAWVIGASPLERFWAGELRRASQQFGDKISFEWFDNLRFEDMLKRVAELPPHSALYYVSLFVDSAGVPLDRDLALPRLRAATNAPIFSYIDSYFGSGIVGGSMLSGEEVGLRMAEASVRILRGELPADLKIPPIVPGPPRYDWRELQHWNIREARLPAASTISFREPKAWEQYRWEIVLVSAILLGQAALISSLLFERRRRQVAEVLARQRSAELAHINRYSMAGELTATIAHELSQPLGAIITNIETAELIINSSDPDLSEIKEILADIRRDDERASEVIVRLRSLLKKTPFAPKPVDLNDVARDTVRFLSALAVGRAVGLVNQISDASFPIKGDPILLQQVIVNLIVNAMDAMSAMPNAEKRVNLSTARDGNSGVISVSDTGPGIAADKLKAVFEPFFTTKPQGMGMGLAIARTIVEAHGGQLLAGNKAGGGAVFYIKLPLASVLE
jgi:signal transduction histidine kinase